jgi:lambda family phage tail tape measure protein
MANIGSLILRLEANMVSFESDMGKAGHAAEKMGERVNRAVETAKHALEALGVAVSLHEFASMVGETIKMTDEMGKMSQKIGISVESLSALKFSAHLADVSFEQLSKGIEHLSKNMLMVAQGAGHTIAVFNGIGMAMRGGPAAAFAELGIRITDTHGKLKSSDAVMMEVSDRFEKMKDGANKTGLAMQIFGKAGADLIPMLNEGSKAIREQRAEAERLGIVMTTQMTDAAAKADDQFKILAARSDALKIQLMNGLLPAINDITEKMIAATREGGAWEGVLVGIGGAMAHILNLDMTKTPLTLLQDQAKDLQIQLTNVLAHIDSEKKSWFPSQSNITYMTKQANELNNQLQDVGKKIQSIQELDSKKTAPIGKLTDPTPTVPSGKTPGQAFVESLKLSVEKTQENEYAMLRLKSAQMGVAKAAEHWIALLQRADSAKAVKEYAIKLAEENAAYKDQYELIGKNTLQTELLTMAKKHQLETQSLINAAEKSGKPVDKAGEAAMWAANAKAVDADTAAIKLNYDAHRSWATGTASAFNTYIENATNAAKQANMVFTNAFKGMEDALVNFVKTGKLNFSSLANGIISDLIRIQAQKAIAGMAGSIFGNMGAAFSYGTNIGSEQTSMLAAQDAGISGARASGGPVSSGSSYLVGERGPEIFKPSGSGTIIPNGGASGGQGISIMVNVDAKGQTTTAGSDAKNMAQLGKRIGDVSRAVILEEMRPGGLLAQAGVHA